MNKIMINQIEADLWELYEAGETIVIPVNFRMICGRGLASQWKSKFPEHAKIARDQSIVLKFIDAFNKNIPFNEEEALVSIYSKNNVRFALCCGLLTTNHIIFFPTKKDWYEKSDLALVEKGMEKLSYIAKYFYKPNKIFLPRIACGFGERDWESEILPIVQKYYEDNMIIVVPPASVYSKYKTSFKRSIRNDKAAKE